MILQKKLVRGIFVFTTLLIVVFIYRANFANEIPAEGDPRLPQVDGGFMLDDLEEIVAPIIHSNFDQVEQSTSSNSTSTAAVDKSKSVPNQVASTTRMEIVVENLTIPWDIAFLPNGNLLITERDGTIVEFNEKTGQSVVIDVSRVFHTGEGGLLGLTLHPNFETNRYIYVYQTSSTDGRSINNVLRYAYRFNKLTEETIIVENIPGAFFHDGGRIAFGPDGNLYIATGDAQNPELAQDTRSLAGKILRVTDEGKIPEDNPFENEVYSYGHRNPQGLTWDNEGALWSTEHGRSGAKSGFDEVNIIFGGSNYGWPESQGDTVFSETVGPKIHSGPDITWAPASAAYYDGSIFFGGLKGETLYEAVIAGVDIVELKKHFVNEFGRIRTVVVGPDGMLYITTSNRDGRGTVREGDDKIIRVNPRNL